MKKLHTKSPCCRGDIRKFGKRRRQCTRCGNTWRIRKKKRGRKSKRADDRFAFKYITRAYPSLQQIAKRRGVGRELIRRKLARGLAAYVRKDSWPIPLGTSPLILIADALWHIIDGEPCTVYIRLVRPRDDAEAHILEPLVIPGIESMTGWEIALEEIPEHLKKRIVALVCDGEPHLVYLGKQHGWILQRCHFHLLASIKNYVSGGPLSRNRAFGRAVLSVVHTILTTPNDTERYQKLEELRVLRRNARNPKLRSRLSGFMKNVEDYISYLHYPDLKLPATTNAAESLNQCIRDMLYRTRGLRSVQSFSLWVRALCLSKKKIKCLPKSQPN